MANCKVLLVEDEIPARTLFRQMIEERSDLFTLVAEAEDGRDALELYHKHKPQLIVTDITMPVMDGLELLRAIANGDGPQPLTVILSCHQDFHYAQQAISLKASSYLIKDDCLSDPSLLARTMEELTRQAHERDESYEKQLRLEHRIRSNELEIERNLFYGMLRGSGSEPEWLHSLELARIPVRSSGFKLLLLELDRSSLRFHIDRQEELKLWQFAGVNVLKELLSAVGPHTVIALDKGRYLAVYVSDRDCSRMTEQVIHAFNTYLKMNGMALQCEFGRGVEEELPTIKELASAPYPFFYKQNGNLSKGQWMALNTFRNIPEELHRLWVKMLRQSLLEPPLAAAALEEERQSLYKQAMDNHWDPEEIKSLYLRAYLDVAQLKESAEGTVLETAIRKKLEQCQTYFSVHDAAFGTFRKLQEQPESKKIDASILRIVQNMQEDLSYPYKLEELAASVNYSVPYFSAMFKKTTGDSFLQYLTRIRIEKAKLLLLTTDRKTFEIAEALGFENYRSFNRIFKKETGITPTDFRRKLE